ncbi:hypothetical protein FOZ76_06785 [Verticiella sediminum]|uniref:Uncharacterized protein n=1 Tax=Verticiella sediminum TaxID=1247510 RepID=A0A556AVP6_9BURK|nr:hypothetical protein [Verticiella sediminum]TSH97022.1 hypothetical protein FOZ76_06785 [Verticiella sediminum]
MSQSQERAVRMALLQARAEVERIELARKISDVREASEPRNLLRNVLPAPLARFFSGQRSGSARASGGAGASGHSLLGEVVSQVTTFYNRYPLMWSTAASFVFRRTRFSRLFRLLGFALAAQRALRLGKAARR